MRIKELFTVPEGTKVTERIFTKVLLSSICSILLCMVCLVSTTWAWFTVSIENQGNVIQIAQVTTDITVKDAQGDKVTADPALGAYFLEAGKYDIQVKVKNTANGPDDLNKAQNDVYVVMTVANNGSPKSYCFTFQGGSNAPQKLEDFQILDATATVSFSVSWIKPASAEDVDNIDQMPAEPATEATTEPTTEPAAEATTEPATEATTEPATEATTQPVEESSTETTVPGETQTEVTQ